MIFIANGILVPIFVTRNLVSTSSEDYYYNPITKNIFYSPMGNWFSLGYEQIQGVTMKNPPKKVEGSMLVTDTTIFLEGTDTAIKPANDLRWIQNYLVNNSKVYYYEPLLLLHPLRELANVDVSSFVVLDNFTYSKDASHVYIKGEMIPDVDPASFAIFKDITGAAADKTKIYFYAFVMDGEKFKIFSTQHNGSRIQSKNSIVYDSSFVYFFDYKNQKIRKESYKNIESVKTTDEGISIDGNLLKREDYLDVH